MQAIMAAAIALDALYALIKTRVERGGTANVGRGQRDIRLPRSARRAPAKTEAPIVYPELGVGVSWPFSAHYAERIVNARSWIFRELGHDGKPTRPINSEIR